MKNLILLFCFLIIIAGLLSCSVGRNNYTPPPLSDAARNPTYAAGVNSNPQSSTSPTRTTSPTATQPTSPTATSTSTSTSSASPTTTTLPTQIARNFSIVRKISQSGRARVDETSTPTPTATTIVPISPSGVSHAVDAAGNIHIVVSDKGVIDPITGRSTTGLYYYSYPRLTYEGRCFLKDIPYGTGHLENLQIMEIAMARDGVNYVAIALNPEGHARLLRFKIDVANFTMTNLQAPPIGVPNIHAAAFDKTADDILWGGSTDGKIYKMNVVMTTSSTSVNIERRINSPFEVFGMECTLDGKVWVTSSRITRIQNVYGVGLNVLETLSEGDFFETYLTIIGQEHQIPEFATIQGIHQLPRPTIINPNVWVGCSTNPDNSWDIFLMKKDPLDPNF